MKMDKMKIHVVINIFARKILPKKKFLTNYKRLKDKLLRHILQWVGGVQSLNVEEHR